MVDEELSLIAQFEVRRRAYVAADGIVVADLPSFASERPACFLVPRNDADAHLH